MITKKDILEILKKALIESEKFDKNDKLLTVNGYVLEIVTDKWGYSEDMGIRFLIRATKENMKNSYDYEPFRDSFDFNYDYARKKGLTTEELLKIYKGDNNLLSLSKANWFAAKDKETATSIVAFLVPHLLRTLQDN